MQYTSKSQIARISTESWVASNGYCLACDSDHILATKPNTEARVASPKADSRAIFQATDRLAVQSLKGRNWSRVVLNCLHRIPSSTFTLTEVYGFEEELSRLFPENHNIRAKIRQQLQVLRDAGIVLFEKRGLYRLKIAGLSSDNSSYAH